MRNKVPAPLTSVTAMTGLLSALLITPVLAQEAAESEEAVTVPETGTTNDTTSEQSDPPTAVDSGAVLDYEPTESISEDLSVSFPVDI